MLWLALWLGWLQKQRFTFSHSFNLGFSTNYFNLLFPLPHLDIFLYFSPSKCHLLLQVLRAGKWSKEYASVLVPGDIVSIKPGDIIPADARLLEGDPLKIDQVSDHVKF